MLATMDYPETPQHPAFNVVLRVNFKAGVDESFGVKFIGSDGSMTVGYNDLDLQKVPRPDEFDSTISSFAKPMQERLKQVWRDRHPETTGGDSSAPRKREVLVRGQQCASGAPQELLSVHP